MINNQSPKEIKDAIWSSLRKSWYFLLPWVLYLLYVNSLQNLSVVLR